MKISIGFIMRTANRFSLVIVGSHKRKKIPLATRLSRWIFLLLLLLIWAMGGCASPQSIVSTSTSTATHAPTATSSPIYTPTPSQTATPVFTPTPTALYPQPHEAVSADNVSQIHQLLLLNTGQEGQQGVLEVTFSPDGRLVAAGLKYDVTAQLWDVYNGQLLHTLSESYQGTNCDGVRDLAFSPDGSRLITAARCNFSIVREWNVESGKPLQILDDGGGDHVAFSSDGRFIAWCAYKKVVLWDAINQRELRTWNPKSDGRFCDIEFSPDSTLLAVFSHESNSLQLWDVESGKSIVTLGDYSYGIWSVAFSPNGRLLAVGTMNRAQIWEIESGKSMQILRLPDEYEYVLDLAFSPSGDMLASTGGVFPRTNPHTKSWQIRFWQVESGQLIHTQPVGIYESSLAFSPNGRMLLTGNSEDGTVRFWGILP